MKKTRGTLMFLALAAVAGALSLAAGPGGDDSSIREESKIRIVTVDDQGNSKEHVFEFGPGAERPFLGVMVSPGEEGGARIEEVVEDSPAERAGLREGDVIVGFDGQQLDAPADLTAEVLGSEPGQRVELEVLRDGERMTLSAEIGERKGLGPWKLDRLGDLDFYFDHDGPQLHHFFSLARRPKLGVQLVEPTGELREYMGAPRDAGVIVSKVLPGTPAEESDVRVGDVIVAADGQEVERARDLVDVLRDKDGESVRLDVVRDRRAMTIEVFIPEREEEEFAGPEADFAPQKPAARPSLKT